MTEFLSDQSLLPTLPSSPGQWPSSFSIEETSRDEILEILLKFYKVSLVKKSYRKSSNNE